MIIEYHRPKTQDEVLTLLSRKDTHTVVIGGGLYLNEIAQDPVAVVDLQALDLNGIELKGKEFRLGASATLQSILDHDKIPLSLVEAIRHQETYNRRQVATIAGSIVAGNGRSAVLCVLLALDGEIVLQGTKKTSERIHLGDFLPIRQELLTGKLITEVILPNISKTAYFYSARSPADLPIVAAAAARWPSGRTRVVLAGYGGQPRMVFDGPDSQGAEIAARDAYSDAADQWASADYRSDTAAVLVLRCLDQISDND